MSRLLLVDGHAYAYRAFYAIRELRSPAGQPTNAIFGFVKMLAKLRAGVGAGAGQTPESGRKSDGAAWVASHVLVIWDGGLSAARQALLPEYKAQRPELPADLRVQLDGMVRFLGAAGVGSLCREGVEADDLIGGIATAAAALGWEVVVASADKDFMQLVTRGSEGRGQRSEPGLRSSDLEPQAERTGWVGLVNPNDRMERIWGAAEVREKCGVWPRQVVDWLSLVGDAVDNVPGVAGVGVKTAARLLEQFGSVNELYQRLDEVASVRVREALRSAEAAVRRNQSLVRLDFEVAGAVTAADLAGWAVGSANWTGLAGMYREWGFRGLLAEAEAAQVAAGRPAQSDLF